MKKILICLGFLWSAAANAQFTPGQLLTASALNSQFALYAPLAGATFTGPVLDNSSLTVAGTVSGAGFTALLGPYLTSANAAAIYLTISNAAATYLTIANASSTYAPLASPVFTGTVTIPGAALSGTFTGTPTFTGAVTFNGTPQITAGAAFSGATPTFSNGVSVISGNISLTSGNVTATSGTVSAASLVSGATNTLSAASGTNRGWQMETGANLRWFAFTNSTPESGSNVGSDYNISRYSDAGSFLDTPFSIQRSTGNATFADGLGVTGTLTPSQTNGIAGTTTNNNANAGSFGEYQTATTSGTSLTNIVNANLTSVSLTAGDWDVSGTCQFSSGTGTTATAEECGTSSTSATFGGLGTFANISVTFATALNDASTAPTQRFSLSSTTTIYLVGVAAFSGGTMTGNGFIRARRVR